MKSIFTLLFLFIGFILFSQNTKFVHKGNEFTLDSRVEKFLGKDKVSEYLTNGTFKLVYFNFFVQNSFELITTLPEGKNILVKEKVFATNSIKELDMLSEKIDLEENNQYYRFGDKYLLVYSQNSFDKKLDQFINSLNK